ncbi:MAG TPA: S8 family serine peptidase, partial [Thermoplasmata archaeon]|nr:S8 family serine peptidase [Thermoplasmata archaeon]
DLTDLYVTRDDASWYVGFPVYLRDQNASFVLLIDVDNETSGAYTSPFAPVDTNTSHADRVNDVAWSPDGTKVATAAGDRFVRIWSRTGQLLSTMQGHAGEPLSVAWSPDGTKVASADKDRLRLWDAATGALIREIQYVPFGDPTITENGILAFSPNGTWIAAGTFKFVHLFNVATGAKFGSVWPANTDVNGVAFNPVGDRLAVALGDNSVRVYAVTPLIFNTPVPATPLFTLSSHTQPVVAIAWSPDGTKIVSGARDNTAKLWDVVTQTVITTMTDQMSWVLGAHWNPAGTQFVTSARGLPPGTSASFAIYNALGILVRLVPQAKALPGVDWSSLGEIATAGEDLTARIWTSAGDWIRTLIAHRPDYALYVHGFSRYSDRESKYVHGTELATWSRWDTILGQWVSAPLANLSGQQAAFQFGDALFNEFSFPRSLVGDPAAISVELFSTGETGTRAQDTVPADRSVDFRNLDFTPGSSSLSAFAWRRIQDYRVSGLSSASSTFHFGFHPGPTVQRKFGALGLLVVDSATPGAYDRVVLDMNDDKVFDASDVAVTRAAPIAAIDNYNATSGAPGQDGYPDISAGMVYFISDGSNPVPYSDRVALRKSAEGAIVRTPAAGDLVAFAGEFRIDPLTTAPSEHGTRIASAIVAQGRLPANLVGTANAAKLVAIVNGLTDVVESWTFAVEGYDGRAGTGDEANVVLSPFNFPTLHNDGWDVFSRTADFLSTQVGQNLVPFVASAGDSGFGYGTVLSPASGPSVIAAGRAGDFSLASSLFGGSEGPNPHARNPAIGGSRGPTPQGFVKPEVLAVDAATLAVPLHAAPDGSSAVSTAAMVGSDVSAAIVAGAVALIREAFAARHGRAPTVDEIRSLLLSGADDAGSDVLTQGAGFLNVSRSVRMAAETADAGLEVTPSLWHPGSYRGNQPRAFTHLSFPGDAESRSLTLWNHGGSPITATAEAVAFTKIGEYVHTNQTRTDVYQPNGNVAFWVNDTGLWKVDGPTLTAVRLSAPFPGLWSNADLIKVTAYSDLGRLTYKIATTYYVNYSYTLKAYDWTIDWAHWGGLGPFPAPAFFMDELNTVAETFHDSNVLEVRAAFPAVDLHEGLVVSLEAVSATLAIEGLTWTFVVEAYERTPFQWISLSPAPVNVPAGGSAAIAANLAVPGNAAIGSYEAAVLVHDGARTTTVPILINVAARAPSLTFGGNLLSTDLFDNNRLFGGYDRALATGTRLSRPTLGDWRFFFFEIPDQGTWTAPAGYKVLVRSAWPGAPSDVDTFAFGRTTADVASQGSSAWYGPFTLKQVGKSEELDKPDFKTVTGGPEDVIAYDLASGLNVLAFRAFSLRGLEMDVRLSGQAGWVNTPTAVDVATRNLAGRAPFTFLSNMDFAGLRASAVGPAQTTAYEELEIQQDVQTWWNFPAWGEWMFRGSFTYPFRVEKALILEVAIQGKADVGDLDMAVFRDVNDNGLIDPEEYLVLDCTPAGGGLCVPTGANTWGYDADGDADERLKWVAPPDGQYFVKVLGFTVNADPGHFDLQISVTLDTGLGYQVLEAPKPLEIVNGTTPLAAFTSVGLNMTWDFPNDTTDDGYGGAVLLGLPNAPGVVVVPVLVLIDRAPPEIVAFQINALNGRLNDADNRTTNDPGPQLVVSVQDYDRGQLVPNSAVLRLDGADMTPLAVISIQYLIRGTKLGLWDGTLTLMPPPLSEGTHTVEASIADRAGNVATGTFTF